MAYKKSDVIISNLPNLNEHLIERNVSSEKFKWIPNGVSIKDSNLDVTLPYVIQAKIPKDKFIVGYAGTVGKANALNYLINASEKIESYSDICILIVGNGVERDRLENLVREKKLENVKFIDAVEKKFVASLIARFDVCYIGWKNSSLYRFGIAANKIPEYLLSGKPVLHSYSGSMDPVKISGAGLSIPSESTDAIAEAILKMYHMSKAERDLMGAKGREFALKNYDYKYIGEKLIKVIEGLDG
jgi:glycosyltransferase involved in cell wall biosynthesis